MKRQIIFFFAILIASLQISCKKKVYENYEKDINNRNMFINEISYYIEKPIKLLILECRSPLKNYTFMPSCSWSYIDGVCLTFENDITLYIMINDFKYTENHSLKGEWDINQCIQEDISDLKLLTISPEDHIYFEKTLLVKFISYNNIEIIDMEKDTSAAATIPIERSEKELTNKGRNVSPGTK